MKVSLHTESSGRWSVVAEAESEVEADALRELYKKQPRTLNARLEQVRGEEKDWVQLVLSPQHSYR